MIASVKAFFSQPTNVVILSTVLFVLVLAALMSLWLHARAIPPIPQEIHYEFNASGYVNSLRYLNKKQCVVELAVYDWYNLSADFPLVHIPKRDQWYELYAEGGNCLAVEVAMASTQQHVSFNAASADADSWFLLHPAEAAYGCGGLEIAWTPSR